MAILISRNPSEINQHQNQNGLEWSRNEQNRLAGSLESAQARANLRNEIGIFQVERGDTLGAIAQGLTGEINWSQRVDYRSSRITAGSRPTVLNAANLIYPGQYVWLENGAIVVADSLPSNTAPAQPYQRTPAAPTPGPRPIAPPQPAVIPPLPVPAAVPRMSQWRPAIAPRQAVPVAALPASPRRALIRHVPGASGENFETSTLSTRSLPTNIEAILSSARGAVTVPTQVPFIISRNLDVGSQGLHVSEGGGYNYTTNFVGAVTAVTPIPTNTAIVINLSNGPNSIEPARVDSPGFAGTLLNEFSHSVTNQLTDEYIRRRSLQLVGQSAINLPSPDDMMEELVEGFSHSYLPPGMYNFQSYNELQSDAFSMSVFPQSVTGRYLVYGQNPLSPPSYNLNRDFTAHNLANFLRTNGHGNHSMSHINQMFRRLYSAHNVGDDAEVTRIFTSYHLNDPDFFAFIQPRYQAVGEAFYTHLSNKINAL